MLLAPSTVGDGSDIIVHLVAAANILSWWSWCYSCRSFLLLLLMLPLLLVLADTSVCKKTLLFCLSLLMTTPISAIVGYCRIAFWTKTGMSGFGCAMEVWIFVTWRYLVDQ